ncbi:translation initiation factor 3 subunit J [Marchantia polymorpha subsp. ruderalis]|uniref:Eukaryotic translation initiation factor 3 30 kDa subunit n=2 Tax=Marchantia polymorpha TaxID=3197 RepID=A0AAF6BTD4_MARPO|nr:hypothetical protein MARPO_0038s0048 [Marchantia polymorpha]BBN15268.1 hypothetical protein Mp_6g18380 [Marchantia polymorpha subsp. ruderalis]|eukprot:PTQ40701.1 hypothetical protein MARPO_0038s0048 [Marchantia polymorpha]
MTGRQKTLCHHLQLLLGNNQSPLGRTKIRGRRKLKNHGRKKTSPPPLPPLYVVVTKPKKKEEKKGKKVAVSLDEGKLTDPLAEKLRQQRLVEEADYQSTTELFGRQKNPDQTLENFIPKSEEDFQDYAELIANKLRPFEKSFHYMTLLKAVMKHAVTSLNAADAKVLASSLTVTANEKLKAEKDASGKKKTGAKKKQLHVDKAEDDGFATGNYDDVDDYDFM